MSDRGGFAALDARSVQLVVLVVIGVAAAISLYVGIANAVDPLRSQDMQWSGARLLLEHVDPYRRYLDYLRGVVPDNPIILSQVPQYPASGLIWMWPFAGLPWDVARPAWAVVNLGFAAGTAYLAAAAVRDRPPAMAVLVIFCLFAASTPLRNGLGNGQQALVSVFFFLASLRVLRRGQTTIAGLFLAISWIKYSITFPLSVVYLRRGRIRAAVIAAAIHLAALAFLAAWTGADPRDLLFGPFRVNALTLAPGYMDMFHVLAPLGRAGLIAAGIGAAALVAAALWCALTRAVEDEATALSFLAIVACVAVNHRPYDMIVLVIPLANVVLTWRDGAGLVHWSTAAACALLWYVMRLAEAGATHVPGTATEMVRGAVWTLCVVAIYLALAAWFMALRPERARPA